MIERHFWLILAAVLITLLIGINSITVPMSLNKQAELNDRHVRDSNSRTCQFLGSKC